MIERLLIGNVWFAIGLGVSVYAVNYYLAMKETYLYHAGAKDYLVFQGIYEPATALPSSATQRRSANVKILAGMLILAIGIGAAWIVCLQLATPRPDVFSILMGGLILLEAATIMRHVRNIVLFHDAPNGKTLKGNVEYSSRLGHTLFYVEMYSFAALYALIFFTTSSWLFLGGALTCFVSGRRQRDWTVMRT